MSTLGLTLTKDALDEVFPFTPLREVDFEIRFSPRLRVNAEIWRLQEQLVSQYPTVANETVIQPTGSVMNVSVFQNPDSGRIIKVSQENFVVAFTRYSCFEDFKDEALRRMLQFCEAFQVSEVGRVGLRYVNHILVPGLQKTAGILKYVRPFTDFDRVPIDQTEQFVNEVLLRFQDHMVTLRGVLLGPLEKGQRVYVLDIDCHTNQQQSVDHLASIVDKYHDSAQKLFLGHITEEYKKVLRGKT